MKYIQLTIATLFFIISINVYAQEEQNSQTFKLKFLAGAAIEFGGESIAEIFFDDGSSQSVNAGQGGSIFAGGEFFFNEKEKISLRGTVGFKYLTTKATDYNITLTRIPIELSVNLYTKNNLRFGAGFTSHQNIVFNSGGLTEKERFSGGFGPKFEFAWKWIGISYTIMSYKDSSNFSFNANAIGITLSSSNLFKTK